MLLLDDVDFVGARITDLRAVNNRPYKCNSAFLFT